MQGRHRNSRGRVHGCGNLTTMMHGCTRILGEVRGYGIGHPDRGWHVASLRNFIDCNVSPSSKGQQMENARCLNDDMNPLV